MVSKVVILKWPSTFFTIRVVQHCTAISATGELFLSRLKHINQIAILRPCTGKCASTEIQSIQWLISWWIVSGLLPTCVLHGTFCSGLTWENTSRNKNCVNYLLSEIIRWSKWCHCAYQSRQSINRQ